MVPEKFFHKKSLGQNFLTDAGFLESIINKIGIKATDTVIEIGTGRGILTKVLAKYAGQVCTYEIDTRLKDFLQTEFENIKNIELNFTDIMNVETFPKDFVVVANIPYYITTPIIMKFLKMAECKKICILIQDEVARRIVAKEGTKDYGALSVTCQAIADCKIIKQVPRQMFRPVPSVDSAFVVIEKCGGKTLPPRFDVFIKSVFSARRKKIRNTVNPAILLKCGINPELRPEQVSTEDFVKICLEIPKNDIIM